MIAIFSCFETFSCGHFCSRIFKKFRFTWLKIFVAAIFTHQWDGYFLIIKNQIFNAVSFQSKIPNSIKFYAKTISERLILKQMKLIIFIGGCCDDCNFQEYLEGGRNESLINKLNFSVLKSCLIISLPDSLECLG